MVSLEVKIPDLSSVNQRIVSGGIAGIATDFNDALAFLNEANPNATLVETYLEFAQLMPRFVMPATAKSLFHALECSHPKISEAGRVVTSLIYMKTAVSASKQYLTGIVEDDEEILQAAFTQILHTISQPSFVHLAAPITVTLSNSAKHGSNQLRLERMATDEQIVDERDEIMDEDEILEPVMNVQLRQELEEILNQLPPRSAFAVACEYGLITDDKGNPISRTGVAERVGGVSEERVRQLNESGLDTLRILPKRFLYPYLHPENLTFSVESEEAKPLSEYLRFELDKSELRAYENVKIRGSIYADWEIGYYWVTGIKMADLIMDPDTLKALFKDNIRTLSDLLTRPVNEIAIIPGIDDSKLEEIKLSVKTFLLKSEYAREDPTQVDL